MFLILSSQRLPEVYNPTLTKCCVSSLEMLCQVFTAVSFSRCLFVGLHLILYLITERLLGCDEVTVLVFFRSLSICIVKHHLISHAAFI